MRRLFNNPRDVLTLSSGQANDFGETEEEGYYRLRFLRRPRRSWRDLVPTLILGAITLSDCAFDLTGARSGGRPTRSASAEAARALARARRPRLSDSPILPANSHLDTGRVRGAWFRVKDRDLP